MGDAGLQVNVAGVSGDLFFGFEHHTLGRCMNAGVTGFSRMAHGAAALHGKRHILKALGVHEMPRLLRGEGLFGVGVQHFRVS